MSVESYRIDSEGEVQTYLRDLLSHAENRNEETLRRHCDRLVDPAWKDRFMAEGRRMLAEA